MTAKKAAPKPKVEAPKEQPAPVSAKGTVAEASAKPDTSERARQIAMGQKEK